MSQMSSSLPEGAAPAWLREKVYKPRRERTVALAHTAVDALVRDGQRVSLASIAMRSRQIDPTGRGLSEPALLNNPDAYAYYVAHRSWTGRPRRRGRVTDGATHRVVDAIKVDRDPARARERYLRLPKHTLVDRLLTVEQAYADRQEVWLRVNDDLLGWQLRARAAEARAAQASSAPAPSLDG